MSQSTGDVIRFGGFVLDRETGRLERGGVPVPLPEQGVRVLAALIERRGDVVARTDLQDLLWPGDTAGDFDNKLNGVVRKIRAALGDDAERPRYVETLPKRGYRFVGTLETSRGAMSVRRTRGASLFAVGTVAAAILLAVGETALVMGRTGPAVPVLAVVPFHAATPSDDGAAVAHHLTEAVTHALARLDATALHLIAPETGRRIGSGSSSGALADYLVTGSVRRTGDSIALQVRLTSRPRGRVVWSETIATPVAKFATAPNRIAQHVARRLRVGIVPVRADDRTLPNGAVEAYWRARMLWSRGTVEEVGQSISLLRRAVDEAPDFTEALVGLADAYNTLAMIGGIIPRDGFDTAAVYARRAIGQNVGLASAHAALGLSLYLGGWAWAEAESVLQRAIALGPGRAEPHAYLASIHSIHGRHDRAIVESHRATRHDPLAPMTNADLAWYYYYAGRYDAAVSQVDHVRALDPDVMGLDLVLALSHHAAGRTREAVAAARALVSLRDGDAIVAQLDSVAAADGPAEAWRWWLARSAMPTKAGQVSYVAAVADALLGDGRLAATIVESAARYRVSWAPFVGVDPAFGMLVRTGELATVMRDMRLCDIAGACDDPATDAEPPTDGAAVSQRTVASR